MEVMRDKADNWRHHLLIENFDPMGVHTGDSITVAPIPDADTRNSRSCATQELRVIRAVGVEPAAQTSSRRQPETRAWYHRDEPAVSPVRRSRQGTAYPTRRSPAKPTPSATCCDRIKNDITRETPRARAEH